MVNETAGPAQHPHDVRQQHRLVDAWRMAGWDISLVGKRGVAEQLMSGEGGAGDLPRYAGGSSSLPLVDIAVQQLSEGNRAPLRRAGAARALALRSRAKAAAREGR